MGRSGAGSGGGSRSGGGSSRSSGGHRHSSSSRSGRSSGSYSRSSSSYGGGGYRSSYHRHYYGGHTYGSQVRESVLVIIILIICIFFGVATAYSSFYNPVKVPDSTIQREALDKSNVNVTDYVADNLDWLVSKRKVEKSMEYFFDKTGVQPYLLITDNINGDTWPNDDTIDMYLTNLYDEMFTDEQHVIVLFLDNGSQWLTHYLAGKTAKVVIDKEAGEILLSYFDYYNGSDMEDDDYFSTCFRKAADKIMTFGSRDNRAWTFLYCGLGLSFVAIVSVIVFQHKRKKKALEVEQSKIDAEILKSDLKEEQDPLLDKYK